MRPNQVFPARPYAEDDDLKEKYTVSYRKQIAEIMTRLSDDEARDTVAELSKKRTRAMTTLRMRWLVFLDRMDSLSFRENRISRPPGSNLLWIADFFCSKKTKQQITDEVISTMQYEYYEALNEKRKVKAAWIHVRGCWSFFNSLTLHRILKTLLDLWRHAGPRG
jgi:hypothetical protein